MVSKEIEMNSTPTQTQTSISSEQTVDINPIPYIQNGWRKLRVTNVWLVVSVGIMATACIVGLIAYAKLLLSRWYGTPINAQNWTELAAQIGIALGVFALVQGLLSIAANRAIFAGAEGVKLTPSALIAQTFQRVPITLATFATLLLLVLFVVGVLVAVGAYIHIALGIILGITLFFASPVAWLFLIPLRCVLVDDTIPHSPFSALRTSFFTVKRAVVAFLVLSVLYVGVSGTVGNIQQFVTMPNESKITSAVRSFEKEQMPNEADLQSILTYMLFVTASSSLFGLAIEYVYMLGLSGIYTRVKEVSPVSPVEGPIQKTPLG